MIEEYLRIRKMSIDEFKAELSCCWERRYGLVCKVILILLNWGLPIWIIWFLMLIIYKYVILK